MRKIQIICVGKTQHDYLKTGIEQFEKKLRRICNLKWTTVKEADYSRGTTSQWRKEEGKRILKALPESHFIFACDEKGRQFSSISFANKLTQLNNAGHSQCCFLIGGAFGLSDEIVSKANLKLSLSTMTFTHQMVRLFLIEQIYRAFTIINNEKYHHE